MFEININQRNSHNPWIQILDTLMATVNAAQTFAEMTRIVTAIFLNGSSMIPPNSENTWSEKIKPFLMAKTITMQMLQS